MYGAGRVCLPGRGTGRSKNLAEAVAACKGDCESLCKWLLHGGRVSVGPGWGGLYGVREGWTELWWVWSHHDEALLVPVLSVCIYISGYMRSGYLGEDQGGDLARILFHIRRRDFLRIRTSGRAATQTSVSPVSGDVYGWSLQFMVPSVKLSFTNLP